MQDFQSALSKTVEHFVSQVTALARQAAIAALQGALPGSLSSNVSSSKGSLGQKRSPTALEALSESFVSFVKKHPGMRIEQINTQLGTRTKDLAGPVRKLVADGAIKTRGQKRSRTYFAA
jgi:hypothetical protein